MRHIRFSLVLLAAAVVAVVALGGSPAESAFPGVDGKIAFVRNRGAGYEDIFVMNADGSGEKRLTNYAGVNSNAGSTPKWSPDGGKIAFTRIFNPPGVLDAYVYVMNADGSGKHAVKDDADTWTVVGDWSPDGSKIAFTRQVSNDDTDIYVMNADGTGEANIINSAWDDGPPVWSPDGTKIAFCSNRDGDYDIYVVNVDAN